MTGIRSRPLTTAPGASAGIGAARAFPRLPSVGSHDGFSMVIRPERTHTSLRSPTQALRSARARSGGEVRLTAYRSPSKSISRPISFPYFHTS